MSASFDVAVIGAGFVGLGVLRELSLRKQKVVCLERSSQIASGVSKGNTGIVCTASDADPGTVEFTCLKHGEGANLRFVQAMNVPHRRSGAIYVAWTEAERLAALRLLEEHTQKQTPAIWLNPDELYQREPSLGPGAQGAVLVDGEIIVEPWLFAVAQALHARQNGAEFWLQSTVKKARYKTGCWHLDVSGPDGPMSISASWVVNCAGLSADKVESFYQPPWFELSPILGDYVIFDPPAEGFSSAIGSVPTPVSRGVYVFCTVWGNLVVGPTRRPLGEGNHSQEVERLRRHAERVCPAVVRERLAVRGTWSGARPSTERRDYRIKIDGPQRWITAAGIRSTGMSGAAGIGRLVADAICPGVAVVPDVVTNPLPDQQRLLEQRSELLSALGADWSPQHTISKVGFAGPGSKM
mmetsp:Transcript_95819/g.256089  ORF Transcript_95819/g.256089 Transcript_95819/m.256089 type:complete len:411 (-) Transcript_95819:2-1234(-)